MESFCEETPIHGFGFIPKSLGTRIRMFWILIILIASALSVSDFIHLVVFYRSVPTLTSIEVHRRVELESQPVPVLCLELNQFYLPAPERNGGNATILTYVPLVAQFAANLTNTAYRYIDVYKALPYDMFYYTYAMLGYMSSFQLLISGHPYEPFYYDMYDAVQDWNLYRSEHISFINSLFQAYIQQGVSFDKLTQLIGSVICNNYIHDNSHLSPVPSDTKLFRIEGCSAGMITHLSIGLLCMRLGNESMWATPNFDLVIPGIRPGQFPGIGEASRSDIYGFFQWHIDFQGRSVYGSTDNSNVYSFQPPLPSFNTTPVYPTFSTLGDYIDYTALSFYEAETQYNDKSFPTIAPYEDFMIGYGQHYKFFSSPFQLAVGPPATVHKSLSVQLNSYLKTYNKKTRPCYTAKQMFNGLLEQRAELFNQVCGCWPSQLFLNNSLNVNTSGQTRCYNKSSSVTPRANASMYDDQASYHVSMNVADAYNLYIFPSEGGSESFTNVNTADQYSLFDRCDITASSTANVVDECDTVLFSVTETVTRSFLQVSGFSDSGFIQIQVRNEVYGAIVESPYKTWSTFVSELGGSIGVWLGGSLIAFLHIPIYIGGRMVRGWKSIKSARQINPAVNIDKTLDPPVKF